MAIKKYSTLYWAIKLEPHCCMQFSVIPRTPLSRRGILLLSRGDFHVLSELPTRHRWFISQRIFHGYQYVDKEYFMVAYNLSSCIFCSSWLFFSMSCSLYWMSVWSYQDVSRLFLCSQWSEKFSSWHHNIRPQKNFDRCPFFHTTLLLHAVILYIYIYQPDCTGRIWHQVNFLRSLTCLNSEVSF